MMPVKQGDAGYYYIVITQLGPVLLDHLRLDYERLDPNYAA